MSAHSLFKAFTLTTFLAYPDQHGIKPFRLSWGAEDPKVRGPVVCSRLSTSIKQRNAIGAHSGSYVRTFNSQVWHPDLKSHSCTSRYTERLPSPLERFHRHTSLNMLSQNRPCPSHLFQPGLTPSRSSRSIHGVILSLKSSAKRSMVVWTYVPVSPSRKHTSSSLRSMRPRGRVQSRSMGRLS